MDLGALPDEQQLCNAATQEGLPFGRPRRRFLRSACRLHGYRPESWLFLRPLDPGFTLVTRSLCGRCPQ